EADDRPGHAAYHRDRGGDTPPKRRRDRPARVAGGHARAGGGAGVPRSRLPAGRAADQGDRRFDRPAGARRQGEGAAGNRQDDRGKDRPDRRDRRDRGGREAPEADPAGRDRVHEAAGAGTQDRAEDLAGAGGGHARGASAGGGAGAAADADRAWTEDRGERPARPEGAGEAEGP